jgi:hypothetical protein
LSSRIWAYVGGDGVKGREKEQRKRRENVIGDREGEKEIEK